MADRSVPVGTVEGIVISMIHPYGYFYIKLGSAERGQNARDIVHKVAALRHLDLQM